MSTLPLGWHLGSSGVGRLEHLCLSVLCFTKSPGLGLRGCHKIQLPYKSYFNAKFTNSKLMQKIHDEQYQNFKER